EFQMVYILKGWMRFWYEGKGEVVAKEGTCILQPPAVKHDVLEWSDDLELLEITSPADFTSEALQAAE
ncbi:MAG: cupin, partial [Alphaproteobacteria bacterium]